MSKRNKRLSEAYRKAVQKQRSVGKNISFSADKPETKKINRKKNKAARKSRRNNR